MVKLLIHVGTHKTGTTTIQRSLSENRELLASQGVYYPDISRFFGGGNDAHHNLAHAIAENTAGARKKIDRFLQHLMDVSDDYRIILLSAEPFYRHGIKDKSNSDDSKTVEQERNEREAYIAEMRSIFSEFDPEISIYFRDPLKFAESLFSNRVVNTSARHDFDKFLKKKWIMFDYNFQLGLFEKYFRQVTAYSYEEKAKEGLVSSFYADHDIGEPKLIPASLRVGISKRATLWALQAKQNNEMTLTSVRQRWLFALQPESKELFKTDAELTYWNSEESRDAFYETYGKPVRDIHFSKPGPFPEIATWDSQRHLTAEKSYRKWAANNRKYLMLRRFSGVASYEVDRNPNKESSDVYHKIIEERGQKHLKVAICATTRNREIMFANLLNSFENMNIPENITPVYVFVENDEAKTMDPTIDAFRNKQADVEVRYVHEPELGIPFARNRAVDEALLLDADVILFVDDDETVAENWLDKLLTRYRSTYLHLIGGPVQAVFDDEATSRWEMGLRRGIKERYQSKIDAAARLARNGKQDKISIATNNWLADSSIFARYHLRFDTTLRHTGGSDTQFYRDVSTKGIPTGWCTDAIVYETVPQDRLSFKYQFWRATSQSRTSLQAKLRRRSYTQTIVQFLPILILRVIGVSIMVITFPIMGSRQITKIARAAGWTYGRLSGLFGKKSNLYQRTTGY